MNRKDKYVISLILIIMILFLSIIVITPFSKLIADNSVPRLKSGTSIFIGPGPTYEEGCDCTYWDNECFCIIQR